MNTRRRLLLGGASVLGLAACGVRTAGWFGAGFAEST